METCLGVWQLVQDVEPHHLERETTPCFVGPDSVLETELDEELFSVVEMYLEVWRTI